MRAKYLTAALFFAGATALPAMAQDLGLSPGLWQYSLKTSLLGQPINESGKECISRKEAQMSLQDAAAELGNGCTITDTAKTAGGLTFAMQCTGAMPGKATGKLTKSGNTLNLSVDGLIGAEGAEMPLKATASATRVNTNC